jgi:alpha-beta hydrolase superfamily lysophospholipase
MTDGLAIPTAALHGPAGAFQAEGREHAVQHRPELRAVGGIDRHAIRWMNVEVPADGVILRGRTMLPPSPRGLVLLAHGSEPTRTNPGARRVASVLVAARYATLLLDLRNSADVGHDPEGQADRVSGAVRWTATVPSIADLPLGLLGMSTGAAAVLGAAARDPQSIRAIVAYAGRPDLAADRLADVVAPTLLIVGGEDALGRALNRDALDLLRCKARLAVVPGAVAQFDETGHLVEAARLATAWFDEHLGAPSPRSSGCAT